MFGMFEWRGKMRSKEEKLEFKKGLEARTLDFSIRVFKLRRIIGFWFLQGSIPSIR